MIILLKPEWVILGVMIGISTAQMKYAQNSAGSPEQYCRNVPAGISPLPDELLMRAAAIILPALGGLDVYEPWPLPAQIQNQLVDAFMERYQQAEQAVSSERAAISAGMATGYMVRYLPEWDEYYKSLSR